MYVNAINNSMAIIDSLQMDKDLREILKTKCYYEMLQYTHKELPDSLISKFKKEVIKKYLKEKYPDEKIIEYHGIAYDEIERTKKNNEKNIQYPLINWNMTEKECLQYCYEKGFTWKGLYEKFDRVSCWCCPLKNLKELKILYKTYPELWNRLKIWERKTYRKSYYRLCTTVFAF